MYQGSCLCSKVTFEVKKFKHAIAHCHCNMCQKFHGAAFSTFAEVALADLNWLSGHELITSYQAKNDTTRQFCRECGSSLTFSSKYNRKDKTLEIAIAALDALPNKLDVNAHIFTESKVKWLNLNDDIPKYLRFRT